MNLKRIQPIVDFIKPYNLYYAKKKGDNFQVKPISWKARLEQKRLAEIQEIVNDHPNIKQLKASFTIKMNSGLLNAQEEWGKAKIFKRYVILRSAEEYTGRETLKYYLHHEIQHLINEDRFGLLGAFIAAVMSLGLIDRTINKYPEKLNKPDILLAFNAVQNHFLAKLGDEFAARSLDEDRVLTRDGTLAYFDRFKIDLKKNIPKFKWTKDNDIRKAIKSNFDPYSKSTNKTLTLLLAENYYEIEDSLGSFNDVPKLVSSYTQDVFKELFGITITFDKPSLT